MGTDKVQKLVSESTIRDKNIRIATTSPELKNKIQVNFNFGSENVYWHIKFNIPLDTRSVSKKTMSVTETSGYILNTEISYDIEENIIIINPLEPYKQDEYYILSISTKVRSVKGQNLKRPIHIMFKLLNNQISEYQTLPKTVQVPKPKRKPPAEKYPGEASAELEAGSRPTHASQPVSKRYSFETGPVDDKVPYDDISLVFPLCLLLSCVCFVAYLVTLNLIAAWIGLAGLIIAIYKISQKKFRSCILYNIGAYFFNSGRHKQALRMFQSAHKIYPKNETAEYACDKARFHIDKNAS